MFASILLLKNYSKNKELSNLILFSIASFISLFGTSTYNFAIGLYVLKLTASGLSFATTLILSILSTILISPFAGVLTDRLDKKLISVVTDILNGLLLILLYLFTANHTLNLSMIYTITFVINALTSLYGINLEAAKPNLVSEKKLISINSINKIVESSSSILGPMIGGIVFAMLDIRFFILINGFSFVLSAILQLFIDFKFCYTDKDKNKEKFNFFKDIIEGISYLKSKKIIINMLGTFILLNFFIGLSITVPMPYIINNVLNLNANFFGIIEAAFPLGMIFGALVIKRVITNYSYERIIKSANILLSTCMIAIGFSVLLHYHIYNNYIYLVYFILVMIFTGIAISFIDIPIFYLLQQTIAEDFRGRVLSLGVSLVKIILPIALIISGSLINLIPSYLLPILGGVGLCVFSILFIKHND